MRGSADRIRRLREVLREDDALATWSGVVVDLFRLPTHRFMKLHRPFVACGRDRFHAKAAKPTAALGEVLIEKATNTFATVVRMNADEMHVARLWCFEDDESENESDQ